MHKQINDSAYLLAPSPQLPELVVFAVNLHVHIALLQVKQGSAIILASPLSLMLFKVVSFRDKDLLASTNLSAALANNTDQISICVKLALGLGEFTKPHLLPAFGNSLCRSLLSLPR
jgi:hypothetical protein